jgi:hypothetical protein
VPSDSLCREVIRPIFLQLPIRYLGYLLNACVYTRFSA